MEIKDIPRFIKRKFGWESLADTPKFLKKYGWKPRLICLEPKNRYYIAIDFVFNQRLSNKIYEKEVLVALRKHKKLRVCLFTPAEGEYSSLKTYCIKEGIGLKIYSEYRINTIVPLSFEKVGRVVAKRIKKEGWFPKVILDEVKNIGRISYRDLLKDLANRLEVNTSKEKQFALIRKYIDKILKSHTEFIGDSLPFMKLSYFERMLQLSKRENREHALHSVRVFIIGCIIIDKFYDDFVSFYRAIFPGTRNINIEYIWLLASLYHDVGKIKEKAYLIYKHNPREKNVALMMALEEEMSKVWQDNEYHLALGNVVELIKHCCTKKEKRQPFTGFAIPSKIDPKLSVVLTESYNKLISHGAIGCFDLAADLLKKIKASKKIRNNTFLLYHIFPAVVAIALHDWHIWHGLRQVKIFPINLAYFPLATLLIYIDTWDYFKRDKEIRMSFVKFVFCRNRVTVYITWYKNKDYLDEKANYESFEKNIRVPKLKFKIKISNEKYENITS